MDWMFISSQNSSLETLINLTVMELGDEAFGR